MTIATRLIELTETNQGRGLEVRLSGQLRKEDYELFVPEVEALIREHGKISLLVRLEDFDGWDAGALWEDLKFDVKHFRDIERLAIVGDEKWERGMAAFCKPFTTADVQFFPVEKIQQARDWTTSGPGEAGT